MSNVKPVEEYPFLETQAPNRQTWYDCLMDERPHVDKNGYLTGEYGKAVIAACRYEYSHQEYLNYGWEDGPVGYVGRFMDDNGYGEFYPALDKLEALTRQQLQEGEGLSKRNDDEAEILSVPICEPKGYHEQAAAAFQDTCWAYMCCCIGAGFGTCGDPCCLNSSKCCCVESALYTEDCWGDEGPCFSFQKLCCLVSHQTLWPGGGPDDGVPLCACCNIRCGGNSDDEIKNTIVNTNAKIMQDAFLCYYCLCCGQGCSMNFPLVKGDQKCCCLRTFASTASCWPSDRGICYQYQKTCCCVEVCTFPPGGGRYDGIPTCACCSFKCGGEDKHESDSESS